MPAKVVKGVLIGVVALLSLTFLINIDLEVSNPTRIHAENGVLDLRAWDLENDGIVNLEGKWEFYWEQLIPPGHFPEPTGYINVPSTWNRFEVDGSELGGTGFATYRLNVLVENQDQLLAIKVPRVFTAYKLWVNGELVASAGQVGRDLSEMTPQYLPQVAIFPASRELEVVVQVSNYYHRSGGILENIQFGLESQILDTRTRALTRDVFIVGSLFIMGLYHLALFAFRTKEHSSLVFGIYCLAIGTRALLAGEGFLIYLFPNLNWEVAHNLQTLAFYLGAPLFVMFIRLIFPQDVPLKAVRFVQVVSLAFSLLVVLTPARIFTHVNPAFQIFLVLIIPYFLYTMFKAIRNKRQGSLIIGVGGLILIMTTVNDIIFLSVILNDYPAPILRSLITMGNMSSFGILAFVFAQSLVLAMKFSTAFTKIEEVSQELQELNISLEQKVQERTSDLAESNSELEQANQELNNMHKFRRDLLANISHDLRSPMTTIKGYVDAIADGIIQDPQEQRKYLQVVREKTIGLSRLTEELFELARLESRELTLELTQVSAHEIVQDVYDRNKLDVINKGLEFVLNIPEASDSQHETVNVDIEHIDRVFSNLVSNAIKHTNGGTITLGYSLEDEGVVFYVQDTGTGISEGDIPNIFDRFYKGDKARSNSSGSGLGLAIAREIVEYHGGRIGVVNTQEGARFFFSLPVGK